MLIRSIRHVRAQVAAAGKAGLVAADLKREVAELVATAPAARLDYVEFFDPEALRPVEQVRTGGHMALAVFVGKTRLIDNGRI